MRLLSVPGAVPGCSRSGATISGGMLMGVSRYAASEFSFLLAVPMMMGATVLDVYKSIGSEHGRCPDVRRRLRDGVYRGADCD